MAHYEFECESCGAKDDAFIPMAQRNEPHPCPKCKKPMTRLMGNPHFVFKGDGFYCNDSKKQEADFIKESRKILMKEGQKVDKIIPHNAPKRKKPCS